MMDIPDDKAEQIQRVIQDDFMRTFAGQTITPASIPALRQRLAALTAIMPQLIDNPDDGDELVG